jgi:hypothetical protein
MPVIPGKFETGRYSKPSGFFIYPGYTVSMFNFDKESSEFVISEHFQRFRLYHHVPFKASNHRPVPFWVVWILCYTWQVFEQVLQAFNEMRCK